MNIKSSDYLEPMDYHKAVTLLRDFFSSKKGFIEVPTQCRLSILAACEDPTTVSPFIYNTEVWPLPQTGQMWLEYELLNKPIDTGYFCLSTSYRQEIDKQNTERYATVFPMFEFELPGDFETLKKTEKELLDFLGFGNGDYPEITYKEAAEKYKSRLLESEHEEQMVSDYGPAVLLTQFPVYSSPFWNMKLNPNNPDYAQKTDVILYGMETIGSAERSTDPEQMRNSFYTISDGLYAKTLFHKFGKDRVEKELEEFLALPFITRSGAGIGMNRMIRALKLLGKI